MPSARREPPSPKYATGFLASFDPESGIFRYCNAGHNPPLLVKGTGEIERLTAMGTVLGILPELGYEDRVRKLEPGDLFVVYSDGVTESENPSGEEYGEQRVTDLITRMRGEQAEAIVDAVADRCEVICDGGIRRGTHIVKALALGADGVADS